MTKIRYIEIKPIQQVLEFENEEQYSEFINKRIREILDYTYPNNINYYDYFKYERVLLNKNGQPRKEVKNPKWLYTKEAREKQKEGFLKYVEKRKQETLNKIIVRKKAEIQFKIDLLNKQLKELEDER